MPLGQEFIADLFAVSLFTPGKTTGEKLRAWLYDEPSNGNGQEEAPIVP